MRNKKEMYRLNPYSKIAAELAKKTEVTKRIKKTKE